MQQTIGLAAHKLGCQRGGRTIFRDLSFKLAPGEALLVSGPNGAGKTSLLRQIAGLLPLAGGELRLAGAGSDDARPELCHYVGHLNAVKPSLSVGENLRFWSEFLGGDGVEIGTALAAFGLAPLAGLPAGLLSAGQKRRLALARILAAPRPLWLLDEPQTALDASSLTHLDSAIKDHLTSGGIAIVASHTPLKTKFSRKIALGKERVA
jgi:heme exporter protein A